MSGVEDRLDKLETALAHAEAMLQDLSDVVAAQDEALERLRAENRRLIARLGRLEELKSSQDNDSGDTSPPLW